jgi:hypothetical protein
MIILKVNRKRPYFQDGLPPGSVVGMSNSEWINEDLFLDWLKYFLIFKSENKDLLILDNHGSNTSYKAIRFCKDHDIELHSTHVLQPLDRTFFLSPSRHSTTRIPQNGCTEIKPKLSIKFECLNFLKNHTTKQLLWEQLLKVSCVQE